MGDYEKRSGLNFVRVNSNEIYFIRFFLLDTNQSEKLLSIINNTRLCNDIAKLSTSWQTSNLEAYHSLIIQYAPKNTSFSYHGMISRLFIIKVTPCEVCFSRLTLAAMHYNHNSGRKQAVTKGGKKRFSVPKIQERWAHST